MRKVGSFYQQPRGFRSLLWAAADPGGVSLDDVDLDGLRRAGSAPSDGAKAPVTAEAGQ